MVQVAQDRATNSPQIQSPTVSLLPVLSMMYSPAAQRIYAAARLLGVGAALTVMWYHNCYLCSSCRSSIVTSPRALHSDDRGLLLC